jgi:hypothetical protein
VSIPVPLPLVVAKDVEEDVALYGVLPAKFSSHTSVEFLDDATSTQLLLDALSGITGGG